MLPLIGHSGLIPLMSWAITLPKGAPSSSLVTDPDDHFPEPGDGIL